MATFEQRFSCTCFVFIGVDTVVVEVVLEKHFCFWSELLNNANVSRWSRTCTWKTTLLQYRLCNDISLVQKNNLSWGNQCSFSPKVCDCSATVLKPRNYYGYKYMHVFANSWRNRALRIKCHFLEYGFGNVGINVNFRSHFRKVLTNLNKVRQCSHSGFICPVPTSVFRSPFPNAGVGLR